VNYGEQQASLQAGVLFFESILTLLYDNKAVLYRSITVLLVIGIKDVVNI
jgi:hypothetical protein